MSTILIASIITTLLCTQISFCCRVHLSVTPALKIRSKRVVQRRKCHYTRPSTQALHCQVHPSGVENVCFACWMWLWFCCCPSRVDNGYNQATWTWHNLRSQRCHNSAHHQLKVIHLTRKTHSSLQSIWMWLQYHAPMLRKIKRGWVWFLGLLACAFKIHDVTPQHANFVWRTTYGSHGPSSRFGSSQVNSGGKQHPMGDPFRDKVNEMHLHASFLIFIEEVLRYQLSLLQFFKECRRQCWKFLQICTGLSLGQVGDLLFHQQYHRYHCAYSTKMGHYSNTPLKSSRFSCPIYRVTATTVRSSVGKIHFLWMILIFVFQCRIGEASNPGPSGTNSQFDNSNNRDVLWIGNCNPTQMLGKEEIFKEWGAGIWGFSETSATVAAQSTIRARLSLQGLNTIFGTAVEPQQRGQLFRGRAGGVAVASHLNIRPYVHPSPDFLYESTRFVDCVVYLNPDTPLYIACIYGVAGTCSAHAERDKHYTSLTNKIFIHAAERAAQFRGPAIIVGDFNAPLELFESWAWLQSKGFKDCALVDQEVYDREPEATSKFQSRHSFLIANQQLLRGFVSCRTAAHYDFDAHPLLVAGFDIPTTCASAITWVLPKSLDEFIFDKDMVEREINRNCHLREQSFQKAILDKNGDEAWRQTTLVLEDSWKTCAQNPDGTLAYVPPGHWGRHSWKPFKKRHNTVPCIRPGRNGDFMPLFSQLPVGLRSHTKQLRRLRALRDQLKNPKASGLVSPEPNSKRYLQCMTLWQTILNAHGFQKGFQWWICTHFTPIVPIQLPDYDFISDLVEVFSQYHQQELQMHAMNHAARNRANQVLDLSQGGGKLFKQVRDFGPPPLNSVSWTEKVAIKRVAWPKEGLTTLPYQGTCNLKKHTPITFQGQEANIISISPVSIKIDRPVKLKSANSPVVTQDLISADIGDMHQQLKSSWSEMWQRDPIQTPVSFWEDFVPFVTCLGDCPSCNFKPLTPELWKLCLKGVKKQSARGADALTTREVGLILGSALNWTLDILKAIENGMRWPSSWTVTRVVALNKGFQARTPLDIRPISILPKMYRLWSRIRSLDVLHHLGTIMPPQVAATAGGISADLLAAYTAIRCEHAHKTAEHLAGLVVDIVKCYNNIPWVPMQMILEKLKVPQQYIHALFEFLHQQLRCFDIKGTCGPMMQATTGIAEGCALSVAMMMALSYCMHRVLQFKIPTIECTAYADNWGLISSLPEDLKQGAELLYNCVSVLRMQLAPHKSWVWTTNPKWKKELEITFDGISVPLKHNAIDLGCDLHYGAKKILHARNQRLDKSKRVLKRISKLKAPRGFKRIMASASGYGAIAYGSEIQYNPVSFWKTSRSHMCLSLGRDVSNASPWLAMLFGKCPLDPQLKHLCRCLLFWRRFLRVFPLIKGIFQKEWNEPTNTRTIGPIANLQSTCKSAGWNAGDFPNMQHETGITLDWLNCSKSHLCKTLRRFWTITVANNCQHRKDFDLQSIDEQLIQRQIGRFDIRGQSLLCAHLSGSACTNHVLCKFNSNISAECPTCQKKDTRSHRLLECKTFDFIRKRPENKALFKWLTAQKQAVVELGLFELDLHPYRLLHAHQVHWPQIQKPEPCEPAVIFVDGSAFFQDQPGLTLCASAVVQVDFLQSNFTIVASMPVPGCDHSSFRAEVFSIFLTLNHIFHPIIYSDCQSVVNHFLVLLDCFHQGISPLILDHWDLWGKIWEQICLRPPYTIKICKTKAHRDPQKLSCATARWEAECNNYVDGVAKNAVKTWNPLFQQVSRAHQQSKSHGALLYKLYAVLVEQAEYIATHQAPSKPVIVPINDFSNRVPIIKQPFVVNFSTSDYHRACPFGEKFYRLFLEWACALQWPHQPSNQHVSSLELYVDFCIFHQTRGPVLVKNKTDKTQQYHLPADCPMATISSPTLADQHMTWSRFLKWVERQNIIWHNAQKISKSKVLGPLGFSMWAPAYNSHPRLTCVDQAYYTINDLLISSTGKTRSLSVPFNHPPIRKL